MSMASSNDRGSWGSRLGFILAAAGSAVGLGNIWGFPTRVGQGGGAVFVLVYLICVFLICAPIMIAELVLGRTSERDPVGAFKFVRTGSKWWMAGALGVLAGVGILSFYCVIAGWTVAYIWFTATGAVSGSPEAVGGFFGNFTANGPLNVFLAFLFLAITAASILGGVRSGIERVTKTLMPTLFALLVILAIRAITLPGAAEGLAYYLRPDFSKLFDVGVLSAALGQAFFSLSLGMGCMITYGSYMSKTESIAHAALWVILLDTTIALLAGFIIFPSGFSIEGFDPTAGGAGLIFTVLPRLFSTLPGGALFGTAFFILLAMAALTSTISLLEVPVSHFIDEHGWPRKKAVLVLTTVTFLLAIPSALGNGAVGSLSNFSAGLGGNFLGLMAIIWNNYALPIGGFLTAIFVGYVWTSEKAIRELISNNAWFPYPKFWGGLIRFVSPVAIAAIILVTVWPVLFPPS
jgi:NSS family neurotransmitter:Na+ symporter